MIIYSFLFIIPLFLYYLGVKDNVTERTSMEKMMVTMGASMLICYTLGMFIGGIFQGEFFSAILFSILFSAFVGIFIGLPHGTLGVIEGLFTGGMAGLMGAMTAEMLTITEVTILLLVLLLLIGLGGFWSVYFWKKQETPLGLKGVLLHLLTFVYLIFVTSLFILYPPYEGSENQVEHHLESVP